MGNEARKTSTRWWLMVVLSSLLLSSCGDTKLQQLNGSNLSWESLRGEWVFINYWAVWCAPCRKEIPELNAFTQGHVLGVNFDGPDLDTLKEHTAELNIEFTQLQDDPSSQLGFERPSVLPATYVFDPKGIYRGVMMGPQTEASLSAWLQPGYELSNLRGDSQ